MALTEENLAKLPLKEKKELFRSFYAAYALTSPSPQKQKNKQLLDRLIQVFELDMETVAEWSDEAQVTLDTVSFFVDQVVKDAA